LAESEPAKYNLTSSSGINRTGQVRRHENATAKNTYSMTIRLPPQIAEALESTAFELRMSQAAFVRRAIRRSLEHAHAHELPVVRRREVQAASRP
jgi:predicted transcriptional regulator